MGLDEYEAVVGQWPGADRPMGRWDRDYGDHAELICDDPDFRIWKEKSGGYLHCAVRNFSPRVWKRMRSWADKQTEDLLAPHFWGMGKKQVKFLHLLGFEFESLAVKNGEPVSVFRRKSNA